jgi:hypothetical protein
MIGFAAKPGTAVLPICSIVSPRDRERYAGSCAPARRSPAKPDCNLRPQSTRRHIVPCKLSDAESASKIVAPSGDRFPTRSRLMRAERSQTPGILISHAVSSDSTSSIARASVRADGAKEGEHEPP